MVAHTHKTLTLQIAVFCLSVVLFVPRSIDAQSSAPTSAATPANVSQTSATPKQSAESSAKNPGDALTIELYSLKVRLENNGSSTRQLDVRVKADTAEGVTELKTLVFDYDSANEKVALDFLRMTKASGSTVEAKPDALADGPAPAAKDAPAFSELREAHVIVPPMGPGDTLTYEVTTSVVNPPAAGEFWFSHSFLSARPAVDEELEISVPAGRAIHIQTAAPFPPNIATAGDRKIYSWKRLNVAPTVSAPDGPPKARDVVLTTFKDWDAFAKWFVAMERNAETPSADLTAKSQSLTADQKTDADKIEALYDFAAKQIHLVRIPPEQANFQIHDAAKVLTAGYGDDLDKCALLAAMLNADGFHSSVALIPTGEKFDPDLPWPGAIAHAVVEVTAGKNTLWMDPSADTLPFQLLLPNSRGKNALVATTAAAPYFAETPVDPPFESTQDVDISGNVTSLGKLTARIRYTLRGDNEYELRTAFERTPQSEWNSVAQTMASIDGLHGTVTSATPSDLTDTRHPFTLDFVLVSPDFLDWSRPRVQVPLLLPSFGLPDAPADASKPIQLGSPLTVTAKLTLELPTNDSPHMPVGAGLKRDYAEYHSVYTAQEHSITAERSLRFISRELPASNRGDYETFTTAVQADESQGLVVDNIIPGVPAEATAPELMQAAAAEMRDQHFANALQLFQQVEQLNPQQANLWLNMGTAQLQLGKYDDAIASLHKQFEANPKDETVNTLLGVAFYDEKKYDEAEAAFKKQLELKPLDQDAYTYLGAVYIDEKQFDKARAQLEKAEVLDPDSAGVHIRLGQAELGMGKTDDALADFEKADTLSPSPLVANDIAYALAENKAALARAKEYADAAIGPTENSLSDIDLRHVTPNNLVAMNALPAFWDTLGWVYFQQGKIAEAQPLIEAAWRLNQMGDTGDHLGQIYEARHEKDLAIRTYEEALAAGGAPAETRERLKKLLGPTNSSAAAMDASVKRASAELMSERIVSLGRSTVSGKAEIVVLVEPGPNGPVVRDARFLAGDDRLAFVTERIHNAGFPALLPHGTRARIVLRGAVVCSAKTAKCDFLFDRPRDLLAGTN
jgi:tetratricopeptide (TPR) repeat protein